MIGKLLKMKPPVAELGKDIVSCADATLIYGVELEVENNYNLDAYWPHEGMDIHNDGSLRNAGFEFVTKPMDFSRLAYVLTSFFKRAKFTEKNYSERCSVHVHANILDLTWEQLQVLVLTYQVFERVLFGFIGEERDKNIFCVPLYDTTLTKTLLEREDISSMQKRMRGWEKYTALNFLPIWTQGSIEFRHMAGTCDVGYILSWCNIIGRLFVFARTTSLKEAKEFFLTLNTTSFYQDAMHKVFKEDAPLLMQAPSFESNVEAGVMVAKWSLLDRVYQKKGAKREDNVVNKEDATAWMKGQKGALWFTEYELYIISVEEFHTHPAGINAILWAKNENGEDVGVWCYRSKLLVPVPEVQF